MKNILTFLLILMFLVGTKTVPAQTFAFGSSNTPALKSQVQNTVIPVKNNQSADSAKPQNLKSGFGNLIRHSSLSNFTIGHLVMLLLGVLFIFLAIKYEYAPLFLITIGSGIIIGNIPFLNNAGLQLGIYEEGSIMNILYFGIAKGIYPSLIFLGIGAMIDFSSLLANPKLILIGAAAQIGIFITFIIAMALDFNIAEAAAVGIIGSADGPTALYLASKLANGSTLTNGLVVQNLIAPIAITTFLLMALVPVIQPPIMRMLTTRKERFIRMKTPRSVSRLEKMLFPLIGLIFTTFLAPSALPLLGMLFFGNILKESGVTKRLALTTRNQLTDIATVLLGLTLGASTQADYFLNSQTVGVVLKIFGLGLFSFVIATIIGVLFAKMMNLFLPDGNKINPLIGCAGVSAIPDCARVAQLEGIRNDSTNHLFMHAMGPNAAGVIGSAVAAGILISFLL